MRLALFDLDHTLLPIDSADTWSYFVVNKGGLDPAVYGARIQEFARTYQAGTFDVEGYVRFQMELLALFPRAMLDAWHRQFMDEHVRPHIRSEALALVESHRNRGDEHKGLPYESGIDTYGDTHGRFGLSFYIYALLFVAFDIEVIFIYLWAIAFRDLLLRGLIGMLIFVVILLLGLAYAWRKGALTWR